MGEKALTQNKMGTAPIFKLIMTMSLPAIFSMTVQALYNVFDSIFVGNLEGIKGSAALEALSLAFPLQMLLVAVGVGTGVGINLLISRRLGEKNFKEANDTATHGLLLSLLSWVVFLILGLTIVEPFFKMYNPSQQVLEYGIQYTKIVMVFSIFSFVQITVEKTLQATGDMIFPMLFQLTGAVTNIILDPLLIYGIGPFPKLEVVGAAVATVAGHALAMIFAVVVLFVKKHRIKVSFKNFKLSKITIKNIYSVGFPSIIMQSIGSIMILGLNAILTAYSGAVAVLGVYYKLQSFIFMPVFGLNQGVMPIIGYNYGARNKKRVYGALKYGVLIAAVIMTVGVILFWTIPDKLLGLFGEGNAILIDVGVNAFRIISLCFIPAAAGIMFTTLFQATGKGLRSLFMSFLRQLVLILPIAFLLFNYVGQKYVWFAFPIAEIGALTVAILFFLNLVKGDFKKLG